ncbi:MAG: hypothetical protein QNK26_11380 [Moritella sp.]|uniref:hypothetical protein n=1 Tax=Moritella sp. TaxID=78556 RepID=UPI0029B543C1|nr:hypothetical protein [Moritella sp.]MDX2321183.1 hypothetical protein [Moritella sp.]
MIKFNQLLSCCMLILLSTFSMPSFAKSVEDLIANNELSITIKIVASDNIVAKQAVTLVIDVATNRWFAKGTRIHDVELAESVILPFNELAINGTQRINGTTWAVQTREIVIYPMQVGIYEVGPILVDVSINTESDGIVSGTIQTKAIEFETSKPAALKDIEQYIVTPALSIAIDGVFDINNEYQIGDAITETVTLTVKDAPAMMIVPLAQTQLTGISIYQKPVKVADKNIRGTITGKREESVTYIFEQAGDYQLPQQTLYWWDPEAGQLKSETIPARTWTVVGNVVSTQHLPGNTSFWPLNINVMVNLLMVLFLCFMVWQSYKHKKWLVNVYEKISHKKSRNCKKSFLEAIDNQQWQIACQQLYLFIYANAVSGTALYQEKPVICLKAYFFDDVENTLLLNKLLQAAYQNSGEKLNKHEAKKLIKKKQKTSKVSGLLINPNKIQLNPMDDDI